MEFEGMWAKVHNNIYGNIYFQFKIQKPRQTTIFA